MQKNWLIRTKDNQIWGPVTKDKILELYQNGTIKSEDEVCSGNGYWFYIKEKELVERFLTKNEIQTFNPIAIYEDDSTQMLQIEPLQANQPAESNNSESSSTQVINLKELQASETPANPPEEKLELNSSDNQAEKKNETFSVIQEIQVVHAPAETISPEQTMPITDFGNKRELSDILLLVLAVMLLVVAVLAFNHRNEIIKKFLDNRFSLVSAYAQDSSETLVKKKEFF